MYQRSCVTLTAFFLHFVFGGRNYGPLYPPTKGEVWPKPKSQINHNIVYTIDPHNFNFTEIGKTCTILSNAIKRYTFIIRNFEGIKMKRDKWNLRLRRKTDFKIRHSNENYQGEVWKININIVVSCEEYPYLGMDESYFLSVGNPVRLVSNTVWGTLRGLETFVQLVHISDDNSEIIIKKTEIRDEPRYPHRGLLIDTSRHYISIFNILKTLDAMAMNKMNALHWHIVDDPSFPYQSENLPNLSYYGAFHRSLVYTKFDIKAIVNYARNRGIRVIPEFDVPGKMIIERDSGALAVRGNMIARRFARCSAHTRSWGEAYPNILSDCHVDGVFSGYGPLDPTSNNTYKLLKELFSEVQDWFPDKYFHLGGDEVQFKCWESDPVVKNYMEVHRVRNIKMLYAKFMVKAFTILGRRSIPIVWQEVFDEKVPLARDTVVQVWKYGAAKVMTAVLLAGYRTIYSSGWYLDQVNVQREWEHFYCEDPRQMVMDYGARRVNLENVIGGEACMWGEMVNDMNILSKIWPRTCAVAERLWSTESPCKKKSGLPDIVYSRLEEHTCRMNCRGIPAQPPSGPGFCVGI